MQQRWHVVDLNINQSLSWFLLSCRLSNSTQVIQRDGQDLAVPTTSVIVLPSYVQSHDPPVCVQALGEWRQSSYVYQRALDALPKENLSPVEEKQKVQYDAGLAAAEKAHQALLSRSTLPSHSYATKAPNHSVIKGPRSQQPWECAEELIPSLMESQTFEASSVSTTWSPIDA